MPNHQLVNNMITPDQFVIQPKALAVGNLIDLVSDGLLDRIPCRDNPVMWDDSTMSQYVESMMLGIHSSACLWFASSGLPKLALLDGFKRLTAINAFRHDRFALTGLTIHTALNGCLYSELSRSPQRRFLEALHVSNILMSSDVDVISHVFHRIR